MDRTLHLLLSLHFCKLLIMSTSIETEEMLTLKEAAAILGLTTVHGVRYHIDAERLVWCIDSRFNRVMVTRRSVEELAANMPRRGKYKRQKKSGK